jgi:hypothetical protein
MVSLTALWLPILLSTVLAFIASSVIHMVLGYHSTDWKRFPNEDGVLDALRQFKLPPGDYAGPIPKSMKEMGSPEFQAKIAKGPRVGMTIQSPSNTMTRSLALWAAYLLVVSLFAAYVASLAFEAGTPYMRVFRLTSTVALAGYALAAWHDWIWYSRSTSYTLKITFDGLVYALLTGGVFGWSWPH